MQRTNRCIEARRSSRLQVHWLLFLATCILLGCHFSEEGIRLETGAGEGVVLSTTQPQARLPLNQQILERMPPALEIPVARVENEARAGFVIHVAIAWSQDNSGGDSMALASIGSLSLFPPDTPGRFTLRSSEAFDELRIAVREFEDYHAWLFFELLPIAEDRPLPEVEVELEPALWLCQLPPNWPGRK